MGSMPIELALGIFKMKCINNDLDCFAHCAKSVYEEIPLFIHGTFKKILCPVLALAKFLHCTSFCLLAFHDSAERLN